MSAGSSDPIGGGPGPWVLLACLFCALLMLAPVGLAAAGFGAMLAVFRGAGGGPSVGATSSVVSRSVVPGSPAMVVAPIQPSMASANNLIVGWGLAAR